ncbi:MAG TPA: phosphonate ABC transporter, permease protein PhnE [Candidatus Jeotgalibaca merdavium]|uniref:Phosphonate ABC transporter, permease protein PhnE n=1 Tax=Candidatus Jeotgalibaca merdavium TaxID=2838627 RepID=A0A9D2I0H9_9LACT|nr:phosphonate ABC transporter, permease protein PhnE [Candidatus Jeotgalibaca merdavium]
MNPSKSVENQFALEPQNRFYKISMFVIVLALILWSATAVNFNGIEASSLQVAKSIVNGLLHPDLEFLFDFSKSGVLYLLFETICIAFLGTIVGAVLAIPFAFLSSYKVMPKPVAYIGRLLTMAVRTIPSLVYGLMFIRVSGPGPFTGVLTMSFVSIGMITKLYIDAIEDIDTGILESMSSMGMTKFEQIYYGILPQLFSYFLTIVIYRFDMNLRDASVLGLVGAGGIGAPLIFAMNAYRWNEVGSILIGLVVLVLVIEYFSNKVRDRLVRG